MIIVYENKIHETGSRQKRKYRFLKEYRKYYLCECVCNGKALYKECFLKVDIDEIVPTPLQKYDGRVGWHL